MSRWIGYVDDATAGGTKLDDLDTDPIPVPTDFIPATSAQVDPGENNLDRNNEVRGRRAYAAPVSFASAPSASIEARAYPKLARKLLRNALSGAITGVTGVAPASVSSTVGPLQSGNLRPLILWLLREGQLDRLTGAVVGELGFNFPVDEEGTLSATLPALYHDVDDPASATDPNGDAALALPTPSYAAFTETYKLRDATAYRGASSVELDDLAGFGFTFNNQLIDDFMTRFRPNHNIEQVTIDGEAHKIWYPERHRYAAQAVTGRIDLSSVNPSRELIRVLTHAEKLVFEIAAGPLGTTPAADDMMRLTIYKHVLTGGGADPLQRDGDQRASYEFSGYLDETTNKDVEATFVGTAALT